MSMKNKTKDTEPQQQHSPPQQPPSPPPLNEKKRKTSSQLPVVIKSKKEADRNVKPPTKTKKVEVVDAQVEEMFNNKRRKKMMKTPQEISLLVEKAMALLEVAVEEDVQLNRMDKPATKKIQMLPLLNDFLSKKHLQAEFMDHGVLTLLKNWLEPLPDGSLPNVMVRASLLKILTDIFPIDIQREDRREQLKKSGLGKAILFLSKTEEEIPSNKKLAKGLIENWSRVLYNKSTNFSDLRIIDKENMGILSTKPCVKKQPVVLLKQQTPLMEADLDFDSSINNIVRGLTKPKAIHQGQKQQQQRASKPEATSSVYLVRPQSNIKSSHIGGKQKLTGRRERIEKNMKKMKASNKRPLQAAKLNAQGRGVFTCV